MDYFFFAIPVFILMLAFLYFKYLNVRNDLNLKIRENKQLYKMLNSFEGALAQFANNYQEKFQKQRLALHVGNHNSLKILTVLIDNFAMIMLESIRKGVEPMMLIKKIYERVDAGSYDQLLIFINGQNEAVRGAWRQKNLAGIIQVLELLLVVKENVRVREEELSH